MKHTITIILFVLSCLISNAQFYVSGAGGYAIPSSGAQLGTKTTLNGIENTYGSYGEGLHTQLRAGYFFNETYGLELAVGYLSGAKQTSAFVDLPSQPVVDITSRGLAYGASLSFVYNFSSNIYGRFGALIKIGGYTEASGSVNGIILPTGTIPDVDMPTTLDINFEQHYHGKLPLGFVGAIGYKYKLNDSFTLFGEIEYMGISVKRDRATMESFDATLREIPNSSLPIDNVRVIFETSGSSLASILYDEIDFVDELPLANTYSSKQLAEKVPYSSLGFNIGITFTFGKGISKSTD